MLRELEKPNRSVLIVSAAGLLRSLSVDPSWQVEFAVSLACSERSVLPGHLDWITINPLPGSLLAHLASWDVGWRCFARPMGLCPLLRLVASILAELRIELLPFQLLRTVYADPPGHWPPLPPR